MEDGVADVRRPRRATYGARPFDGKDRREGVIPEGKGREAAVWVLAGMETMRKRRASLRPVLVSMRPKLLAFNCFREQRCHPAFAASARMSG
jgi:hypothetical protein